MKTNCHQNQLQRNDRPGSPDLFDEDGSEVSSPNKVTNETSLRKLENSFETGGDDCNSVTDNAHSRVAKPLFKKTSRDNLNQRDDIDFKLTAAKEKRNRLSRRSLGSNILSQESDGVKTVPVEDVNRERKYCLRKHTPTKREIETKSRTSRAIHKVNQSELNANEESLGQSNSKDKSSAINRSLEESSAATGSDMDNNLPGKNVFFNIVSRCYFTRFLFRYRYQHVSANLLQS